MNWKLILSLSIFGLLMGMAAVMGFTRNIEPFLWAIIGAVSAVWIARKAPSKHFQHGFVVGFINATLAAVVEFVFFSRYVQHYPEFNDPAFQPPGGLGPRTLILALGPVIGVASGLVVGLMTWVVWKLMKKAARPVPSS